MDKREESLKHCTCGHERRNHVFALHRCTKAGCTCTAFQAKQTLAEVVPPKGKNLNLGEVWRKGVGEMKGE